MTDSNTTPTAGSTDEPADEAPDERRSGVRERYADIAASDDGCCGTACDGTSPAPPDATARSLEIGYDPDDLAESPDDANLGLGCGNPVAMANLERGETVLDLGSGGGFDCFVAAREVSPEGRVVGVDMTPEMIERARRAAAESDRENVEFRLGEIEHLPVADDAVDVVVSNCVLNLSPEKPRVLAEAARVLRPGGRLSISDLVATEPLPAPVREDPELIEACVGGAATTDDLESWLGAAGFEDASITVEGEWDATYEREPLPIVSARIEARLPE